MTDFLAVNGQPSVLLNIWMSYNIKFRVILTLLKLWYQLIRMSFIHYGTENEACLAIFIHTVL